MLENLVGKYWELACGNARLLFSTLPNNLTLLLNCFCCGPTSDKSLGTLFILSPSKLAKEVLPISNVALLGYAAKTPGKYTL